MVLLHLFINVPLLRFLSFLISVPFVFLQITVWKRYSDFRKLHQNLWQLHKNVCSQSELFPPFAKAKVFGKHLYLIKLYVTGH